MISNKGDISAKIEIKDTIYIVTATENGHSRYVWDAMDTIKNTKTGEYQTRSRSEWKKIFDKYLK